MNCPTRSKANSRSGKLLALALVMIAGAGCVLPPMPETGVTGRYVSEAESAFLNQPGVDRAEVTKTLGMPSYTLPEERVFLYSWTEEKEWHSPVGIYGPHAAIDMGDINYKRKAHNTGLFIQFDADDKVLRHELLSYPETTSRPRACQLWLARTNQQATVTSAPR